MFEALMIFMALATFAAVLVWCFKVIKRPGGRAAGGVAGHRPGLKWSGRVDGALPIKRLTLLQANCLHDAAFAALVVCDSDHQFYDHGDDFVVHANRTVDSLVRHGFLATNGRGAYVLTDAGARAYETLPVQA